MRTSCPDGPHNEGVDLAHLVEAQFARQHDHVGELRVEAQRLDVGYAQLRGDMHLQADLPRIEDRGHVRGDDGVYAGLLRQVQHPPGLVHLLVIKRDVQGHVALDAVFTADAHDLRQILRLEIVRGMRAHVQVADTEIDRIGTALDRSRKTLEIARRGHDLQFLPVHGGLFGA